MLAAVPSGENLIIRNSKAVKKSGRAKMLYQELVLRTVLRVKTIIKAKTKGSASVKIIAGITVATVTKYVNQLSLPIKYAIKEIIKVIFPVVCSEIINRGIGASHNRYQ